MESDGMGSGSAKQADGLAGGLVRPIVRVPDPLLRRVARRCSPTDPRVLAVAADLRRTIQVHPGCWGLSAPQIGWLIRVIAVDVTDDRRVGVCHGPLVLVNPELVVAMGRRTGREGCLSIPNVVANVVRANRILVAASVPGGGSITLETSGFEARVLLHEMDHLDGMLILDRAQTLADLWPRGTRRSAPCGEPPDVIHASVSPPA